MSPNWPFHYPSKLHRMCILILLIHWFIYGLSFIVVSAIWLTFSEHGPRFFFHFRKWPIYTDLVSSHYVPLFTCSVERAQAEQLWSRQAWNTSPDKGNHKHERNCKICLLITRSELAKHSFGLLKNLTFTPPIYFISEVGVLFHKSTENMPKALT